MVWFWVEKSKVNVTGSLSAFSHYYPQHNSKPNDPKVLKLGIGNDGCSTSGMVLELKGQRSTLELGLTAIRRGFELYECLLVQLYCVVHCSVENYSWYGS